MEAEEGAGGADAGEAAGTAGDGSLRVGRGRGGSKSSNRPCLAILLGMLLLGFTSKYMYVI